MLVEGNLRKMEGRLGPDNVVQYQLPIKDVLEPLEPVDMNALIGKVIHLEYLGHINSVLSGEKMKKSFGEGLTYREFMESPLASPSIVRPEMSRIHEGIALRDFDWEMEHHMKPHIVYIALTSGYKVGVTRDKNVPYRWIDQGATLAVPIAEVPYRQLAGAIEVSLKPYIADKTHWQKMLKGVVEDERSIEDVRTEILPLIPEEYREFIKADSPPVHIHYPLAQHPPKVKSSKLDKVPLISKRLAGIKGQYLIFEDGTVFNVRSHSGYRVRIGLEENQFTSKQSSLFGH